MNQALHRAAGLRIGPIATRIDAGHVAAYAAATAVGGPDMAGPDMAGLDMAATGRDGEVPATYPAVWLWHPEAQAAVAGAAADGKAPVLVAQRFDYRRALRIGAAYSFEIERYMDAADPDAFLIEAQVFAEDGEVVATFAATYRLFAGPAA